MDQLTRDAIAAQKAGISYGKYMAQKEQKNLEVRKKKKQGMATASVPQVLPCQICGKQIPKTYNGRKYCSAACADEARSRQVREKNNRIRADRLAELAAGKKDA